ncbi:DUF4383 domain-containing protein [Agromyces albus]|uniref:DUF4383 domain-containing protein n=1 Tax=Agromyces albus TaxID=205332 RepID=A0A4Q2L8F8_9MICO|nr:DUF4383 domain-containing protein [Agromyces albus]RXZ73340.1 DUF4383 domain-containing protein [Agromyces albus]
MSETRSVADRGYAETAVQKTALVVGIVFLLVGIAGFIPGLTTGVETMTFAGHESGALLLGVFQVSILHNIVHLLFGVAGLAFARSAAGSRNFLIWGGVVYLVLWVYGLIVTGDHPANFVPMNAADGWLHLALGVGMVLLGIFVGRNLATTRAREPRGRTAV